MTFKSKVRHNEAYYDYVSNISTYYINGFSVATLDHYKDEFEDIIEMTESDKDFYYSEMLKNYNEYKKN